jgi:hypothetical protein
MLPVADFAPDAEEDPADAVGAGKTVERTPDPGADVVPDDGYVAVAEAVVESACAMAGVAGEEVFAVAGSVATDVSVVSASDAVGSEVSAVLLFA